MKKESLKENIAKILGVSSHEKDIAFEIFLEKITEVLNYNQAVKINGLGVFQLKKHIANEDEQSLIGSNDNKKDKIIYSAFDQKSSRESNSLFLSFDVKAKTKDDFEFDDEIFSPGVGKPIIPINPEADDSDSSIHLIRKSLEQRITQLIEENEKIENFDIWDDFYKNVDKNSEQENIEEVFPEVEPKDELQIEDINAIEEKNEISEFIDKQEDITDEIDEEEFDSFSEEENKATESSIDNESFSQEEIDKLLNNVEANSDNDILSDDKFSPEKDLDAFAELTSLFYDENEGVDSDDPFASLEKTFSGEIIEDENDEDIIEPQEENETEESVDNIEEEIDNSDFNDEEIEDNLEDFNEDEIIEENLEDNSKPVKDEEELRKTVRANVTVEYSPENDDEKIPEESAKKKFGLLFWGIASTFLIVTIAGIYFLFFNSSSVKQNNTETFVLADSLQQENIIKPVLRKDDTVEVKKEIPTEAIKETPTETVVEKKPETSSVNNSIKPNVNMTDDVEVGNFIFTNGTKYSVQVSSWKRKSEADQEAQRFKSLGYSADVVSANLKKLGTWYRVRVGYFDSIEKAKEFQNKQN